MPWHRERPLPPEDQRRARLRRVLQTAITQTRYARDYESEVEAFDRLPVVELLELLRHPERYAVEKARPVLERLRYPLGDAPRTAVIARPVETSRRVRRFPSLQDPSLRAFAPQAVAAPLDAFRAAAQDPLVHPPLRNAVLVFSGILEGPVTLEDGDFLWQRYQVPAFEQFLGLDGEVLAWECEVHHGLHVREEAAHFENGGGERLLVSFLGNPRLPVLRLDTGFNGRIIPDGCPCGEMSPRLTDLRRRPGRAGEFMERRMAAAVS